MGARRSRRTRVGASTVERRVRRLGGRPAHEPRHRGRVGRRRRRARVRRRRRPRHPPRLGRRGQHRSRRLQPAPGLPARRRPSAALTHLVADRQASSRHSDHCRLRPGDRRRPDRLRRVVVRQRQQRPPHGLRRLVHPERGTTGPAPGAGGTAPRRHPGRRRRSPPTSGGARRPHGRRLRALLAPCQPHDI